MLYRVLTLTGFLCCALVVASFALFARDQLSGASKHQVNEIASSYQSPATPVKPHVPGQPRRFIDGAWRFLTSPFRPLIQSNNKWALELAPTFIALVVYGMGFGFLARYSRGWS